MTTKTKRMSALLLALVMVTSLFTGQILPAYADEPAARETWEAVHSYTIFAPHVAGIQTREVYQYALGARAFSDGNTEVAYKFDSTYFVFATNRIGNVYYNLTAGDGIMDRLVSGGEGMNPAQTFVPVVYDSASRTYLAGPYFTVDNQEFYYMDAPVSNSQGAIGDGNLQGPESGTLTDITVFYNAVTGDITETTPRLVPDTNEPPVIDPSIKGPDSQGNYYKPIGVPAHVYEVVTDNTTGASKVPVEYILDTNSDGDNNPATNSNTNLPVEKYNNDYYVESPLNIYHKVKNDGTYDAETGIWGGSDGKLGGSNDEAVVKYGAGWYVSMGQNIFKPVSGSTAGALVGGGEDENPATAPAGPIYYHSSSGKYFIGPKTDGDGINFYYGDPLGGNGLVDSESTGTEDDDIIWYLGSDENMTTVKPTVQATGVALGKSSTSLQVGQSETISFSVQPAGASQSVTWSTGNAAVATVDATGKITAVGPGTAVITATTGNGKTANVNVTVSAATATGVTLGKSSTSLQVGQSETISFSVQPAGASQSVTWSTGNAAVATVDATGKITAVSPGTAVITATTGNGKTANVTVTVSAATATGVTLGKSSTALQVGQSETIGFTVQPAGAAQSVTWSSSNPAVATVDSATGKITAVSVGSATITAKTANNKTATCTVTVSAAPTTGITLTQERFWLRVGETATLDYTVYPAGGSQAVTWTSSDSTYLSVDTNGKVTAKATSVGTNSTVMSMVTITAKTPDGKTATCLIAVVPTDAVTVTEFRVGEHKNAGLPGNGRIHSMDEYISYSSSVTGDWKSITARAVGVGYLGNTTGGWNKDTCVVMVVWPQESAAPSTGISLDRNTVTVKALDDWETVSLNATVYPQTASQIVSWMDVPGALEITPAGKIRPISAGTYYITAIAVNGQTATCTVIVTD